MREYVTTALCGVFLIIQPLLYRLDGIVGHGDIMFVSLFFVLTVSFLYCAMSLRKSKHAASGSSPQSPARTAAVVTWLDLAVAGYLLYCIVNYLIARHGQADPLWAFQWTALIGAYVLFRTLPDKRAVLYALALSGVVQSCIAIGQQMWWLESNHINFRITGSLGNPGQLGGYLAVCFTAAFFLAVEAFAGKKRIAAILSTIILIILVCGLVLADSRAGWLGAGCGAGLCLFYRIGSATRKRKGAILATALVGLAGAGALLFLYRPASAQARLLIWRVSADMIADKPLFGHGAGSFSEKYMLYQADYLDRHPDSDLTFLADNVGYPYNEPLHIGIEQGIAGLLLAAAMFWCAFGVRDKRSRGFKALLFSLVVLSMFSYPADVFPLMFLFAVLPGCIGGTPVRIIKLKPGLSGRTLPASALILCLCIGLLGGICCSRYARITNALDSLYAAPRGDASAALYLRDHFPCFRNSPAMRSAYLVWLANNTDNEDDLQYLNETVPRCETYLAAGDAFMRFGQYSKSEYYYLTASSMIPTRMMPNYSLWKLYIQQGDTTKAIRAARRVVTQELKFENTVNIRKRAEAARWLEDVLK